MAPNINTTPRSSTITNALLSIIGSLVLIILMWVKQDIADIKLTLADVVKNTQMNSDKISFNDGSILQLQKETEKQRIDFSQFKEKYFLKEDEIE